MIRAVLGQEDHRDPYMWIKSFTANGTVLEALTLNRGSEMMYVYSRTNEILVRTWCRVSRIPISTGSAAGGQTGQRRS